MPSLDLAEIYIPKIARSHAHTDLLTWIDDISANYNANFPDMSLNAHIFDNSTNHMYSTYEFLYYRSTGVPAYNSSYPNDATKDCLFYNTDASASVFTETYRCKPNFVNSLYTRQNLIGETDGAYIHSLVNVMYVQDKIYQLMGTTTDQFNTFKKVADRLTDLSANDLIDELSADVSSASSDYTTMSNTVTSNKSLVDASFVAIKASITSNKSLADASFVSLTSSIATATSSLSPIALAFDVSYNVLLSRAAANKSLIDPSYVHVIGLFPTLTNNVGDLTNAFDLSFQFVDGQIGNATSLVSANRSLFDASYADLLSKKNGISSRESVNKTSVDMSIMDADNSVGILNSSITGNKALMDLSFQSVYTIAETQALSTLANYYVKSYFDTSFAALGVSAQSDVNTTTHKITSTTGKIGVGYGAVAPTYPIDVSGDFRDTNGGYLNSLVLGKTAASSYTLDVSGNMRVSNYMYIGDSDPSRNFPLFIGSTLTNGYEESNYGYYTDQNYGNQWNNGTRTWTTDPVSIYSVGVLWANYFIAYSDSRIKTNVVDISDGDAIARVRQLQPVTYKYRDVIANGRGDHYGFVAQDVSGIIPYAVSRATKMVPNFMVSCVIGEDASGMKIVASEPVEFLPLTDPSWNGVYAVTLYDGASVKKEVSVDLVVDSSNIYVTDATASLLVVGDAYFLYGQDVDDCGAVDLNDIYTANVAASQEVDRQMQAVSDILSDGDEYIRDMAGSLIGTVKSKAFKRRIGTGQLRVVFRLNENLSVGDYYHSLGDGYCIMSNEDDKRHTYTYAQGLEAKTYASVSDTVTIGGTVYRTALINVRFL